MQKGFKKVVVSLIRANPGLTPDEYATMALDHGLCGSDSKNQVFSLATTLRKEVREGRMPEIKAVKVNGRLHLFPIDYDTGQRITLPKKDSAVTLLLPPDVTKNVDNLVELGSFGNRGDALIWLAREGMKAKQQKLENAGKVVQQIKGLKQSVSI